MEWGPLQPILSLLEGGNECQESSKSLDTVLSLALSGEELTAAVRASSISQLDHVLDHEALAALPLSFLLLLFAKSSKLEHVRQCEELSETRAKLLPQMAQLLYQLPVPVAAKELRRLSVLCNQYAHQAVTMQQSIKTIFPLKTFLRRFHEQVNAVLTPLHAQFLYLCLHSKCYFAAVELLDQTLVEIHPQSHLVTCVDFLGYAYYGGLLYLGAKRYQEALDFFQLVITAPAVSLSAFVIEAYKKLVLLTLLVEGARVILPKYTPFVVVRHVESHCAAYVDLVNAFVGDKTFAAVQEVMAKHYELFAQDKNLGLVKQVAQAFKQRKVLELKRTYATIDLAQIATLDGMVNTDAGATEKTLLGLISTSQMDAVIDKQKAMVRFVLEKEASGVHHDDGQDEATKKLQEEMEKLAMVASQLRYMDVELVTSAKFQSRWHKDKDRRSRVTVHNQSSEERSLIEGPSAMETMRE